MLINLIFNMKHNAETLEATKGILLLSCMKCGAHQRTEPKVKDGRLDVHTPDKDCFSCGGADDPTAAWRVDFRAYHILKLQGFLGFKPQAQAWWIEIKELFKKHILRKSNPNV